MTFEAPVQAAFVAVAGVFAEGVAVEAVKMPVVAAVQQREVYFRREAGNEAGNQARATAFRPGHFPEQVDVLPKVAVAQPYIPVVAAVELEPVVVGGLAGPAARCTG
jgi:hypothetical protein